MYTLKSDKSAYLRVRRGVTQGDIERIFRFPVCRDVFEGAIIKILPPPSGFCYALPGDDYAAIASREGVERERLEMYNGNQPVYPSKKIWLP